MMATSIEYGVPSQAVPRRNAVGGRLADLTAHRASRSSIALATPLATRRAPGLRRVHDVRFRLFMRPLRRRTSKLGDRRRVGLQSSNRLTASDPLTLMPICATTMIAPLSAFSQSTPSPVPVEHRPATIPSRRARCRPWSNRPTASPQCWTISAVAKPSSSRALARSRQRRCSRRHIHLTPPRWSRSRATRIRWLNALMGSIPRKSSVPWLPCGAR